ncbi:MAG: EpsG family protein [Oscillospiraceae bacterium]|nr:EpsG family protein [Oscillospiraceae bacterium]
MLLVYSGLIFLVYMQFAAGQNYKRNRTLCILIFLYLFLISAFKAIPASPDLISYDASFNRLPGWSYRRIWDGWRVEETVKDGVFYMLAKVFSEVGASSSVWMGFISLLFAAGASWFIFRNSAKPMLSLTLLLSLEYFQFTLSGLRQTMALSIVLLFSYEFILQRKPVHFIISLLVASLFHSSALAFLPAYIVAGWKLGWKQVVLVSVLLFIFFFFPDSIRSAIEALAWNDTIASYATRTKGLSWSGFVIQLCILVFCLFFRKDMKLNSQWRWLRIDAFINCMVIGLCLLVLSTQIAEMFRIAYYYTICCIAAVPNAVVENKRRENHSTMYIIIGACMIAYMLWSRAYFNLTFFWQV